MHKPLLLKLTTVVLVVTLMSMGVTTFFVTLFAQNTFRQNLENDLASDARLVRFWMSEREPNGLQQPIVTLGRDLGRRITIIDRKGEVIADSHEDPEVMDNHSNRPEFRRALEQEFGTAERVSQTTGQALIYVAFPLEDGGAVRVASESAVIYDLLASLYRGALVIAMLVALLALGIAYLITRNITDPLMDLLLVTKRLQAGEFGRRVLVRSRDEIGQLGKAFNELSETLEEMFDTIKDRESKLNTVLSSMDDAVLAVNMQRKIILANRSVAEMTGLDEDYLLGKDQVEVIRNAELGQILTQTMIDETTINEEIQLYPGSKRTLAVSSSPLTGEDGTTVGAVAVLRDVTDLRRLERMRKEFVANVSHELRTPLTSIKGFVETLLNSSTDDKGIREKFLRIINGETDRMITLINDLLDLSRIESGNQAVHMEPVDIHQVFQETIDVLEAKAELKGIKLENNISKSIMVKGDAKLLRQVATNLVDNGIKYTQQPGKVWVAAEVKEKNVEITVEDNGLGIPSDHLERVFERFYRVDKGRSRQMGGTGLGLSIVKHIIDKHKGTIKAESELGQGTRIRLTLPLAKVK